MSPTNKKHHGKAKNATTTPSHTPNAAPPLDALPPAPTTRTAFREFIELADLKSIKHFLDTAASLPEGENLRLLWARAFKEGLTTGHHLYGKTEEKLNEAHNSGYEAGYDEGRREEQGDWLIEGHGEHCGFQPTVVHEDSAVQTENDPPPRLMSTAAVQVDIPKPTPPHSVTMTAIQVNAPNLPPPPHVEIQANVPRTANAIVQTTPLGTQDTGSQTSLHPVPTPDPVHITSPPSPPLNWADDAASLLILLSRSTPRDLSALRSSSPNPFSSLQRRKNQSQTNSPQPFPHREHFSNPRQKNSRCCVSSFHFSPPRSSSFQFRLDRVHPQRTPHFSPRSALNWDGDPRLFELSQALNALGWVQQ